MKIAFWSNREKSSVTSNLVAVSIVLAHCYNVKTTVFENHRGEVDLAGCFLKKHHESIVRENKAYYLGFKEYDCFVERLLYGKGAGKQGISRITVLEGFLYYVCQAGVQKDTFELQFKESVDSLIQEAQSDGIAIIDTKSRCNISSKIILNESDIVVVNLKHNPFYIHDFFERYSELSEKSFFIISDCARKEFASAVSILKEYGVDEEVIAYIPHSEEFRIAVHNGCSVEFFIDSFRYGVYNPGFLFVQRVKETAKALYNFMIRKESDKDKIYSQK